MANGWKDVRVTLDAELHARVVAAKGDTSWQELVDGWAKKWLATEVNGDGYGSVPEYDQGR